MRQLALAHFNLGVVHEEQEENKKRFTPPRKPSAET